MVTNDQNLRNWTGKQAKVVKSGSITKMPEKAIPLLVSLTTRPLFSLTPLPKLFGILIVVFHVWESVITSTTPVAEGMPGSFI